MGMRRPGTQSAERSHVNDLSFNFLRLRSRTFAAHPLQRFARHQKRSARVRSKNIIPLTHGQALEFRRVVVGRVVYQNVDSAELMAGLLHHFPNTAFVRNIALQRKGAHSETAKIDDCVLRFPRGSEKGDSNVSSRSGKS